MPGAVRTAGARSRGQGLPRSAAACPEGRCSARGPSLHARPAAVRKHVFSPARGCQGKGLAGEGLWAVRPCPQFAPGARRPLPPPRLSSSSLDTEVSTAVESRERLLPAPQRFPREDGRGCGSEGACSLPERPLAGARHDGGCLPAPGAPGSCWLGSPRHSSPRPRRAGAASGTCQQQQAGRWPPWPRWHPASRGGGWRPTQEVPLD